MPKPNVGDIQSIFRNQLHVFDGDNWIPMGEEQTDERQSKIDGLLKWQEYYAKKYEKIGRDTYKQKLIEITDELKGLGYISPITKEEYVKPEPSYSVYDEKAGLAKEVDAVPTPRLKDNFIKIQRENDELRRELKKTGGEVERLAKVCNRDHLRIIKLDKKIEELEAKVKSHSLVKEMKLGDKIFGKRLEDYTDEELDKLYAKMKIHQQQVADYKNKTGSTPQSFNKYIPKEHWKDE